MNKRYFLLLLLSPVFVWGQRFELAPPQIQVDSIFFRESAKVTLAFDMENAVIHYTTTGGYPSDDMPSYTKPLIVKESGPVRAKVRHPEFSSSPMIERRLLKASYLPDSVVLRKPADPLYPARQDTSLFDLQKGSRDLKDGRWMGFRGDTVVLEVYFKKPVSCRSLVVSNLVDADYWIFPPARIEVFGATGDKSWQPLGVRTARDIGATTKPQTDYDLFQQVLLRPVEVERFFIRIFPFGNLPAWHSGAGTPAWLFIDEIVFQ